MPRKKKTKEPKVEEPKVEEPKVEKPKQKKVKSDIDGRKIGNSIIRVVSDIVQNGSEYKKIETIDGLTFILNETDYNNQVSK